MKIGLLQYDVEWLDVAANFKTIESHIRACTDLPELIFLPEMFNTGYIMFPHKVEKYESLPTILKMQEIAQNHNITLAGSIPNKVGEIFYNSFFCVNAKGVVGQYDKIHLFTLAGEDSHYSAGKKTDDISILDVKLRPQVCYDLRFPYSSYNNSDYDVLAYVANWPKPRIAQWKSLLTARAIENQAYTVGVNRVGLDANGFDYNGHSLVVDFTGEIILDCGEQEGLFCVELNLDKMASYRKKMPFLKDQKLII